MADDYEWRWVCPQEANMKVKEQEMVNSYGGQNGEIAEVDREPQNTEKVVNGGGEKGWVKRRNINYTTVRHKLLHLKVTI